jgi:chemotaxis protein histidine kinase CheA
MTRLTGEFQTDLTMTEALAACAEAVHGLGWRIESVEGSRIVSFPNGNNGSPRIELGLGDEGKGTSIRITGSDTDEAPVEEEALIGDLDRVRDAVEESVDEASADAKQAPEGGNGAGPPAAAAKTEERPIEDAKVEPEKAEPEKAETKAEPEAREPEKAAAAKAEPEQAEDRVDEAQAAADDAAADGEQAATAPPGWYPNPEGDDERFWDGEQWTQRYRSPQSEPDEEEPEPERAEPVEPAAEPVELAGEPQPDEQPRVVAAKPTPDAGDRSPSKDVLWGLALAFGAVGGSAAAFSVPDTAFFMPLCFGIAGLALAIAAFTVPGKNAWWAVVAVIASIGGIAIGVHKYSNYQDTKDKISQAQQQLQNLTPPK